MPPLIVGANAKVGGKASVQPSSVVAALPAPPTMAEGDFPGEYCLCDPKLPGWAAALGHTVHDRAPG